MDASFISPNGRLLSTKREYRAPEDEYSLMIRRLPREGVCLQRGYATRSRWQCVRRPRKPAAPHNPAPTAAVIPIAMPVASTHAMAICRLLAGLHLLFDVAAPISPALPCCVDLRRPMPADCRARRVPHPSSST